MPKKSKGVKMEVDKPDAKDEEELPDHIKDVRDNVFVNEYGVSNTRGIRDPDAFLGYGIDNEWNADEFLKNMEVRVVKYEKDQDKPLDPKVLKILGGSDPRGKGSTMEVDIVGIDTGIANALRRILISEVPTIAIDIVNVYQNTSILCDEVMSHRLGLIPIKGDPALMEDAPIALSEDDCSYRVFEEPGHLHPRNTLVFRLKEKCTLNENAPPLADARERYHKSEIYSRDLKWVCQSGQEELFEGELPGVLYDDILIAKLRPGQEIELECFAIKGTGRVHTKWSPVCPASYRLLPKIVFVKDKTLPRDWLRGDNVQPEPAESPFTEGTFVKVQPKGSKGRTYLGNLIRTFDATESGEENGSVPTVTVRYTDHKGKERSLKHVPYEGDERVEPAEQIWDENADTLVKRCPMNVFDIEDSAEFPGHRRAVAARPRDCTMCRECIRLPGWKDRLKLRRVRDHFIFKIESVGQYEAPELLNEAMKIFKSKASTLKRHVTNLHLHPEHEKVPNGPRTGSRGNAAGRM